MFDCRNDVTQEAKSTGHQGVTDSWDLRGQQAQPIHFTGEKQRSRKARDFPKESQEPVRSLVHDGLYSDQPGHWALSPGCLAVLCSTTEVRNSLRTRSDFLIIQC